MGSLLKIKILLILTLIKGISAMNISTIISIGFIWGTLLFLPKPMLATFLQSALGATTLLASIVISGILVWRQQIANHNKLMRSQGLLHTDKPVSDK